MEFSKNMGMEKWKLGRIYVAFWKEKIYRKDVTAKCENF